MKLSLKTKVATVPVLLMTAVVALVIGLLLWSVGFVWQSQAAFLSQNQAEQAQSAIRGLESQALAIAGMAAETPGVAEAYRLALQGKETEGRGRLRSAFDPIQQRLSGPLGIKNIRIHFHLPPAKSFLRVWRAAGSNDGGDDLSAFRNTVLRVNRDHAVVRGIELGREGMAIRAIVPVIDHSGEYLGSVEAFFDLSDVYQVVRAQREMGVAVYMLKDMVQTADFKLADSKQGGLLVVGDLARTYSSDPKSTDPYVTADLLAQAKKQAVSGTQGDRVITIVPLNDYSGEFKGALAYVWDASGLLGRVNSAKWIAIGSGLALIALAGLYLWLTMSAAVRTILRIIQDLAASARQTLAASHQVSASSQAIASGASEQAASLEETTASLQTIAEMASDSVHKSEQAEELSKVARNHVGDGGKAMERMATAIDSIKGNADRTAAIIKTIDEIAFQTNLLALNAAVEAARAGDAGRGFAIVAEEVRNLATRSAEAAKATGQILEESQSRAAQGVAVTSELNLLLRKIDEAVNQVSSLVSETAEACKNQSEGVTQINKAVTQISSVTQSAAASSEETAAASEELSAQSETQSAMVRKLSDVIGSNGPRATDMKEYPLLGTVTSDNEGVHGIVSGDARRKRSASPLR